LKALCLRGQTRAQEGRGTQTRLANQQKIDRGYLEILNSGTGYDDLLAGLIDAFHDTVGTKEENLALRNRMRELESRIAGLEKRLDSEKECLRKTA